MKKLDEKKKEMAKKMRQKGRESLNSVRSKTANNEGNYLYEAPNEQERA